MSHAFALRNELRSLATPDTIVCRCESVPLSALDREWSPRQAKLTTRIGMGPCQGRLCGRVGQGGGHVAAGGGPLPAEGRMVSSA